MLSILIPATDLSVMNLKEIEVEVDELARPMPSREELRVQEALSNRFLDSSLEQRRTGCRRLDDMEPEFVI